MKYFNYCFLIKNVKFYNFLIIIFCLVACNDKKNVFEAKISEEYEVEYKRDTIFISNRNIANNEIVSENYVKGEYGYYLVTNNQKKIFLSISKDTIFDNNNEFSTYVTKISKTGKNQFETSTILVNDRDSILLTKFIYDQNYKILKIQKNSTIEFKPN